MMDKLLKWVRKGAHPCRNLKCGQNVSVFGEANWSWPINIWQESGSAPSAPKDWQKLSMKHAQKKPLTQFSKVFRRAHQLQPQRSPLAIVRVFQNQLRRIDHAAFSYFLLVLVKIGMPWHSVRVVNLCIFMFSPQAQPRWASQAHQGQQQRSTSRVERCFMFLFIVSQYSGKWSLLNLCLWWDVPFISLKLFFTLYLHQGARCFDFKTTSQEERKAYHEARRAQTTAAPKKQLTKAWHHELGTSGKRRQV